ncbi:hypothetical protein GA0061105_1324 [Rhizobium aethiopicum]|uniref:Peptidase M4 n=1 Tax=Rhizobium aethiopicum TaxID=1138170 RepID=A0A1C3YC77_9HYPH|nr:hypothetical protein [Rhizobium aethiopicum]SCB62096.1 hypothetical protein GA0061105_1324 [Rhizobium aethiopicum]
MDNKDLIQKPLSRRLRIFSFDPSIAARFDLAGIGEISISVPWEDLQPGPVGEYIEVVDIDPASEVIYAPVDLNDTWLLAQDGHAPSEGNPQFHQQMVYAVAMTTIGHFQQALGRTALWSPHREPTGPKKYFVRRLRIYPHALRDRNAYYSPDKKALLFGYFPVGRKDKDNTPGTLVHTCLSHDIIAHETTHALLDGVHPRFNEPVNPDVFAFHEAFADIVALFQHFSYPTALRDQIARTRGDLEAESLLGQLAQQFGLASGRGGSLRDALGTRDPKTNVWRPTEPDVRALEKTAEPHARGAILVAAVFRAFLTVYKSRSRDLLRIASEGTGVLRAGDIHPDLAARLAEEAARCAAYVLQMCIRAIDYCPPVGITFGDYLRALVTADTDLNPEDPLGYRLAFVESFRAWGIHPRGMRSMSVESLLWPSAKDLITELIFSNPLKDEDSKDRIARLNQALQSMNAKYESVRSDERWNQKTSDQDMSLAARTAPADLEPVHFDDTDRYKIWRDAEEMSQIFWKWFDDDSQVLAHALGIVRNNNASLIRSANVTPQRKPTVYQDGNDYKFEVHSVRTANRRGRQGWTTSELVVEITQRRRGYLDEAKQHEKDASSTPIPDKERGDFYYRSGCTLLINPRTMEIRRVIRTAGTIDDDQELARVRNFLTGGGLEPGNAFEMARNAMRAREPFAMLHR